MLTTAEADGIREMLNFLNTDDVLAVAQTTTNHMIAFVTLNEAIEAILKYTEKPSDFLQRKKVTKAVIFQYIRKIGEVVSVNADKTKLMKSCLRFWQSSDAVEPLYHLDDESISDKSRSFQEEMPVEYPQTSQGSMQQMSAEFVSWFFSTLNALNHFGPQHFWPDCKLFLTSNKSASEVDERVIWGAENVAKLLTDYILYDQLYFNPNISQEAIKYEEEQHGLVKISTSGVVHKLRNCIGLFDFGFGLIRDPLFNHNWKIKFVHVLFHVTCNKLGVENGKNDSMYQNQLAISS